MFRPTYSIVFAIKPASFEYFFRIKGSFRPNKVRFQRGQTQGTASRRVIQQRLNDKKENY
jgi:hypothetical protein